MSADNELKCNNLKCRKQLAGEGRAVVTNCSRMISSYVCNGHIIRRNSPRIVSSGGKVCSLAPTTDYKSSNELLVLSDISRKVCSGNLGSASPTTFDSKESTVASAFQAMVFKNAQERLMAVERQTNSAREELRGANVKNASLVAEVDTLNRKLREMLEQIREKDRQISKLQGNYTKASTMDAVANAVNNELQHSMANIANIAHAPRSSRGHSFTSEGFPAQSPMLTTPVTKQPQSHQPQAFIPASARRNETPGGLFDLGQRRSSERQQQQHGAYEAQRKADAYNYQENHREPHRENQNVMDANQMNPRRHPAISPDQQALLTGVLNNRHSYSARQPLGMSNINSNNGGEARTPMLNNVKSHTDIRALNDSGFGMKPPVANAKAVVEKHRYQQQPQDNQPRAENRSAQITNSNMQDKNRNGTYPDRVMALQAQGRMLGGGQQQGGGSGSTLRRFYELLETTGFYDYWLVRFMVYVYREEEILPEDSCDLCSVTLQQVLDIELYPQSLNG
ncbi:hypothetical protein QFC21_005233 [Naganishia friedmannii]|uniref:Uncharacterized protein n=1 Tax=Naganishia friedmannii TaxID=89922 RepID=A0ACC2VBF8_9TREE|nr:hypothetical protein QFC21_005233 [Naganishia friedmannii]